MIVEGQTLGGAAQGIGTALFEEMAFDANGQPQASTLADYMLPGATDMPRITIHHLDFYNGRRPHSSLDRRTPDQVYFTHPHGSLTTADAPLIAAEKLFRQPGPPQWPPRQSLR
jgi:hypothetical protein